MHAILRNISDNVQYIIYFGDKNNFERLDRTIAVSRKDVLCKAYFILTMSIPQEIGPAQSS